MRDTVLQLWPEIQWIQNTELREKVTRVWELALERSPLTPRCEPDPIHAAGSQLSHDLYGK